MEKESEFFNFTLQIFSSLTSTILKIGFEINIVVLSFVVGLVVDPIMMSALHFFQCPYIVQVHLRSTSTSTCMIGVVFSLGSSLKCSLSTSTCMIDVVFSLGGQKENVLNFDDCDDSLTVCWNGWQERNSQIYMIAKMLATC